MSKQLQNIVCERKTYSYTPNTHEHSFVQVLFPLEGSMNIQTKEYSMEINDDIIFLIPSSCLHTYYAIERNEFLVIDIPKNFLNPFYLNTINYFKMDKSWKAIRYLLLDEISNYDYSSKSIYHIVSLIAKKIRSNPNLKSIEYIHDHLSEDLEIGKLASIENLHPVYYAQWFKKRMGQPPVTYIQEARLKEAKKLLIETNISVTNISLQVGYNQLSSLSRLFCKYEGVSPKIYRYHNS